MMGGAFIGGLTSYNKIGHKIAYSYINNESSLDATQLDEFSLSVTVLSAYSLDAITTWGN